jgi:hypothetical protein
LADDIEVTRLQSNGGDTTDRFYWTLVGYKGKQPGIPTSTFRAKYFDRTNGKLFAEADKGRFLSAISKDYVTSKNFKFRTNEKLEWTVSDANNIIEKGFEYPKTSDYSDNTSDITHSRDTLPSPSKDELRQIIARSEEKMVELREKVNYAENQLNMSRGEIDRLSLENSFLKSEMERLLRDQEIEIKKYREEINSLKFPLTKHKKYDPSWDFAKNSVEENYNNLRKLMSKVSSLERTNASLKESLLE